MQLRLAALALGLVTGFVFGWARLTDPETFHRMLALRSADIYLLMGAAVAVVFVGARLLRGHQALVTRGLQPRLERAAERARHRTESPAQAIGAADVL
jgi:hypothetical protein